MKGIKKKFRLKWESERKDYEYKSCWKYDFYSPTILSCAIGVALQVRGVKTDGNVTEIVDKNEERKWVVFGLFKNDISNQSLRE